MKLEYAMICIDCDEVFDGMAFRGACPSCTSRQIAPINKWVSGTRHIKPASVIRLRIPAKRRTLLLTGSN